MFVKTNRLGTVSKHTIYYQLNNLNIINRFIDLALIENNGNYLMLKVTHSKWGLKKKTLIQNHLPFSYIINMSYEKYYF